MRTKVNKKKEGLKMELIENKECEICERKLEKDNPGPYCMVCIKDIEEAELDEF